MKMARKLYRFLIKGWSYHKIVCVLILTCTFGSVAGLNCQGANDKSKSHSRHSNYNNQQRTKASITKKVTSEQGKSNRSFPLIWDCPYNTQKFVGRDKYLRSMQRSLRQHKVSAVVAMGGVGKSAIARAYASKFKSNYDVVMWFNAQIDIPTQMEELADKYVTFIDKNNTNYRNYSTKRKLNYIRQKLRTDSHRFLLIFDNAITYNELKSHFIHNQNPRGECHILITSRSSVPWPNQIRLPMFNAQESMTLIRKITGSNDDAAIAKLASQLKNYPVAVSRAASYIKTSHLELTDYIRDFSKKRSYILQQAKDVKGLLNDYYWTSYTTTSMALSSIKQRSKAAWDLLFCLSLLKNINIPMAYIKEWVAQFAKGEVAENLLSIIQSQSILEENGKFFNIHELVSEIIRHHIPKDKRQEYLAKSVKILLSIFEGRSDLVVARVIKDRYHLDHAEEILKRIKGKQHDSKAVIALKTAMMLCYDLGLKNHKRDSQLLKELDKYFGKQKSKWFGLLHEPSEVEAIYYMTKSRNVGVYDKKSVEYAKKSLDIFMTLKDPHQKKMYPINRLILCLSIKGDLKQAKKYIDLGEKYLNLCKSDLYRFSFTNSKLQYALTSGRNNNAMQFIAEESLAYYDKLYAYPTSQMFQLTKIAAAFVRLKRYERLKYILDKLDKKMKIYYGADDIPQFLPLVCSKLYRGMYYIAQGKEYYAVAEDLIEKAISIYKAGHKGFEDSLYVAKAYMALGEIYLNLDRNKQDNKRKSYHYYTKAGKILDKVLSSKKNDYHSQYLCQMVKVGAINNHFGITVENYVKHIKIFGGSHPPQYRYDLVPGFQGQTTALLGE